jgi:alpha-tubulin suppressor-like RCC1 family protein
LILPVASGTSCSSTKDILLAGDAPTPTQDGGAGDASADGPEPDICKGTCIGPIAQLTIGGAHGCVLLADRQLECWGSNEKGQLARSPRTKLLVVNPPAVVSAVGRATYVSAGSDHTCAVVDARVRCWGNGWEGQLGHGENIAEGTTDPVEARGLADAIAVAAGANSTCAIRAKGEVACWGAIFGLNDALTAYLVNVPTDVGVSGATSVAVSDGHACALLEDATVTCWGGAGMLGTGAPAGSMKPVRVVGVSDAKAIAVGDDHTCALLRSGRVSCWGKNDNVPYSGQLGNGVREEGSIAPVQVPGITDAVAVAAGRSHTCALLATNRIKCWGYNLFGQVGAGDYEPALTPRDVLGIANAAAIVLGHDRSCAVLADATIECWGWGTRGPDVKSATPVLLEAVP